MVKRIVLAFIITALVLALFAFGVQTTTRSEDGIPIVQNGLKSALVKGKPVQLSLETDLVIDLEELRLAEAGLTEASCFDTDSKGNIYLITISNTGNNVFWFDTQGRYQGSFGRKGQGPGELAYPAGVCANSRDEIEVTDVRNRKLVVFKNDGSLVREVSNLGLLQVQPRANGGYLAIESNYDSEAASTIHSIWVCDAGLKKFKKILEFPQAFAPSGKITGVDPGIIWGGFNLNSIFVSGAPGQKYDVIRFDLNGKPIRRLRKDYGPVAIPGDYKARVRAGYSSAPDYLAMLDFPKYFPPFQGGFADDDGRLFVMTYERGAKPHEYIHDVFDPDGIFVARIAIDNHGTSGRSERPLFTIARRGRIYNLREKEDGFKELVVRRMVWK